MKKLIIIIIFMVATIFIHANIKVFSKEINSIDCPSYEGDINKRGNVKNATIAFDLLLNQDEGLKDTVVSTSFLKSKNKPIDYYAPWKANDNNIKTAWVEGKKGDGIGEKIFLSPLDGFKSKKINFIIVNGYAENEKLFYLNNRIKKAKLTIYEARFDVCGGYYSKRRSDLVINVSKIIDLNDSMEPQNFAIETKELSSDSDPEKTNLITLIAELEILEIYKGTKYDDTCISEFNIKGID